MCTRRTLRMPRFTRETHAQPSLSNFTRRDSEFGECARSRGTTRLEQKFPTSPQNKKTKLTHCSIYVPMRTISTSHKMNVVLTLIGLPQKSQNVSCWRYTPPQTGPLPGPPGSYLSRLLAHKFKPNKITILVIPTYLTC